MGLASLAVAFAMMHAAPGTAVNNAAFRGFTSLAGFSSVDLWGSGEHAYLSPEIDAGLDWNQLVVSWDVQAAPGAQVSISARAIYPDHATKFYNLGIWSADGIAAPRTSLSGQKDSNGNVLTDTLALNAMARKMQLLVALRPAPGGPPPKVDFLGLCFSNTADPIPPDRKPAAVEPMPVPEKCQMDYPNGGGYCSATSVSMVLNYWGQKLHRPDLEQDVPAVVAGVYDSAFQGTGNWPFNTAYAATFPGIRAYITRFTSVAELRAWVAAGFPVITSGSLALLEGKPKPKGDPGHLVVLVGFTESGDPIINDPAHSDVRRVYKLENFENSWNDSDRTVYLIYPETMKPPPDLRGHWFDG